MSVTRRNWKCYTSLANGKAVSGGTRCSLSGCTVGHVLVSVWFHLDKTARSTRMTNRTVQLLMASSRSPWAGEQNMTTRVDILWTEHMFLQGDIYGLFNEA